MKKVAVIMGSDSDLPIAEKAAAQLKELGIPFTQHACENGARGPGKGCAHLRAVCRLTP